MAAASSRASIRRSPTRCWNGTRREAIRGYRSEEELRHLIGTGVSAAAICHCARSWTRPASRKVQIVASSGFGPAKCRVMADAKAPIDVVGTGCFMPAELDRDLCHRRHRRIRRHATVKVGREFLHRRPSGNGALK